MINIPYEVNRLRTHFYLDGIREKFAAGKPIPPPGYVLWDCTRRCNLHCEHCGASKETYAQELTTPLIIKTIDELAAMRVRMFAVTGGEPLLRKDLLDVLIHARRRGLITGIATNGFFLDRDMAERIRAAGVYSVQISLDGMEQTHNRIRGNASSFAKAVQAIRFLIQLRVPVVSVATTVTSRNLGELDSLRPFLQELGVTMWRLAVVMPIGRAQAAGMSLRGKPLASLFGFVQSHRRSRPRIYLGENIPFLGEWERRLRNSPVICPVGFMACCIGVDGHVRGCPEQPDTPENREGSLQEKTFADIWQHGFGRYRRREILAADRDCAECAWKDDCFGGCWVMRTESHHCIRQLLAPPAPTAGE